MNKEVQDSLPSDVTRGRLRAIAVCKRTPQPHVLAIRVSAKKIDFSLDKIPIEN